MNDDDLAEYLANAVDDEAKTRQKEQNDFKQITNDLAREIVALQKVISTQKAQVNKTH